MKKGLKIILISLVSLIGILLLAGGITIASILSPNRLTKIVNKEAPKFLTCKFHLDKVDLTFFKTFPKIGVEIHNLTLLNPVYGAPTDTLLDVKSCVAALNIREFLKNDHILVKNFKLQDGTVNLFTTSDGKTNYDILITDASKPSTEFTYSVDLEKVSTEDIDIRYIDLSNNILAQAKDLNLNIKGDYTNKDVDGQLRLNTQEMLFKTLDSNRTSVSCHQLDLRFKGTMAQLNQLDGDLKVNLSQAALQTAANSYFDSLDIALNSNLSANLSNQQLQLNETKLKIDKYNISLSGKAQRDTSTGNIDLDLSYKTDTWPLHDVLAMIPENILGDMLDGMDLDGKLGLAGTVVGTLSDSQTPVVTADIILKEGTFAMDNMPLTFHKINTQVGLNLDLEHQSDVNIKELTCYTGNNKLAASGTIRDLMGKMLFDINASGDLHLADFKQFLPSAITKCNAETHANIHAKFDYQQLTAMAIDQMKASGTLHFKQLDFCYDDSLTIQSPDATVDIQFPVSEKPYNIGEWAAIKLRAGSLTGSKLGMGEILAKETNLSAYINNLMDSTQELKCGVVYDFGTLTGKMDTLNVHLQHPTGKFVMQNSNDLALILNSNALNAQMGRDLAATTGTLSIDAKSHYNEKATSTLLQWNPEAKIDLSQGMLVLNNLEIPVSVQKLKADLTTEQLTIKQANGQFGHSDFNLNGKIVDIDKYLDNKGVLAGNLNLKSNYIDINQIMDIVSGMGVEDSIMAEVPESSKEDPFMVPFGMDIRLNTHINRALYEDVEVRNIGGHVSVKDGILVLDEMGFTSEAARMQLTAMYKSPRKNHLFLGLDFHLLDIKIDKLIEMIPEVDTVMPMLKSFAGNAEFHFAIETYLKSNYDLKYSTLRGAAAINGKDLVVLDQETYNKISKLLRFKKGTTNRIDSLSAEATIFKNEVDVYPFAVSIDKYQAVLSGRHNLDMTYNYNISLLKPIRLGLDIIGTDKRKFKVGKAKYVTMFKPEKQNVVEKNVMQLKTQINNALKANVKEQP